MEVPTVSPRKELGLLIVVILKAQHLPDPHRFSKQDPFVIATLGEEEVRTKTDKGGGQVPLWDEEFRFKLYEAEDKSEGQTLELKVMRKEGVRAKDEELIGTGSVVVDGKSWLEFDEWIELKTGEGKYVGELYVEMTFYPLEAQQRKSSTSGLQRHPSKLDPSSRGPVPASLQPGNLPQSLSRLSLNEHYQQQPPPSKQLPDLPRAQSDGEGLLPFPGEPESSHPMPMPSVQHHSQSQYLQATPMPAQQDPRPNLLSHDSNPSLSSSPGQYTYSPLAQPPPHSQQEPTSYPFLSPPGPHNPELSTHTAQPFQPHSVSYPPTLQSSSAYQATPQFHHATSLPVSPPPIPPRSSSAASSITETMPGSFRPQTHYNPSPSPSPGRVENLAPSPHHNYASSHSPSPAPSPSTSRFASTSSSRPPLPPTPAGFTTSPSLAPSVASKHHEVAQERERDGQNSFPPPSYQVAPLLHPPPLPSRPPSQSTMNADVDRERRRGENALEEERARKERERISEERKLARIREAQEARARKLAQESEDQRLAIEAEDRERAAVRDRREAERRADEDFVRRLQAEEREREERERRDEELARTLREEDEAERLRREKADEDFTQLESSRLSNVLHLGNCLGGMSGGVEESISGLGITFDYLSPAQRQRERTASPSTFNPSKHLLHLQHRPLQHSVSYDDGLNSRRMYYQQPEPMIRQESGISGTSSQRRVRIAVGTPEVLGPGGGKEQMYLHPHQDLSPLSDFETSSTSASDTASSQPFSPASLSSLPSSTESGAYPNFQHHSQIHSPAHEKPQYIPREHHAPGMRAETSRPYPPSEPSESAHSSHSQISHLSRQSYHRPMANPNNASPASQRPSRLPAFLQERQRQTLSRPKSMVELGQLYSSQGASSIQYVDYQRREEEEEEDEAERDHLSVHDGRSPESVPSSAGGLQRRHLERQLEEQKRLLEEERRKLRQSEGRPRERDGDPRPIARARSRSLSAQEMKQLADAESSRRMPRSRSYSVNMRSQSSMQGLQLAETGGAFVALDRFTQSYSKGEDITPFSTSDGMAQGEEAVVTEEGLDEEEEDRDTVISVSSNVPIQPGRPAALNRQSTLLTAGANPSRRSRELTRLLQPTGKNGVITLGSIAGSPTPSSVSTAYTSSTRQGAPSRAGTSVSTLSSAPPLILEQAKSTSKARVELDLMLETPLVVEGGILKGRLEIRVRKPKEKEGEVWVGRPKVRVVGFEELSSQDARHIFFHHANSVSSMEDSKGNSSPLPCCELEADEEGFRQGRVGQHSVPFKMVIPIGKGAKGGWKGKQGVVRYIAIASIKLKSKNGSNRSIAHFYRHVEIFPFFNPAIVLAPAVKPLYAEASKGLFMGGSGKVNLSAKMHRGTWVAGQRCYVDVSVENESSKKIKTLTLALVRTTTVFRPRAHLNAGTGRDPVSGEADLDGDACQTQTTRKKICETTLEMGKKGSKGVTAKGSWMGVEAGEASDFSHSLQVPPDALSISRGRHLEVTYSVKVSVGGSLSADVSCDIPVRIVNFVSLDPPPGHIGTSPLPERSNRPLNRSWSTSLKNGRVDSLRTKQQGRTGPIARMASVDSFHLSDLNGGRGPSRLGAPALSRIASLNSLRTDDLERGGSPQNGTPMSRAATAPLSAQAPPSSSARGQLLVDRAKERQLQHQMSLQCISTAIASATARRSGLSPQSQQLSPIDVGGELTEAQWNEEQDRHYGGGGQMAYDDSGSILRNEMYAPDGLGIQLDDLDEVPDDDAYLDEEDENEHRSPEELAYLGESDDELDTLIQSHFSEDEEAEEFETRPVSRLSKPPASPRWSERPGLAAEPVVTRSPAVRSRASSPIKAPLSVDVAPSPRSITKRTSETFGFATPSSPVKAHIDLPHVSPLHFDTNGRDDDLESMPPPSRTSRPLPHRPSPAHGPSSPSKPSRAAAELSKQPSTSSLKRSSNVLRKSSSTRSLRQTSLDAVLPELDFGAPSASDSETAPTPPIHDSRASPALSSRSIKSHSSRSSMMMPSPTSPRKVIVARSSASATSSPISLRSTRSISDFRTTTTTAPLPPPTRKSSVLPSVKNKITALETREATLQKLAHTSGRARVNASQLDRSDSVSSQMTMATSEASFKLSDLTRGNSMASFKAPILRRNFSDMPPVPSLPSNHQY
ncbi:uncharacterized protein JCM6883_002807 [Sporobolomyces salmoneus]|uniref:uncharacterized protein n=1 Tax=Sporobolomyces salmoneus TaxID=183962 RepID=UPI00317BFDC4